MPPFLNEPTSTSSVNDHDADHPTAEAKQEPHNGTAQPTHWSPTNAAEFDLRSDTITTPTPAMLAAITATTLQDDVFTEDPTTNALESFIAELTGKPAALLVLSGTMGNQLAMRAHLTAPPYSVLADARSHIMAWEAGGLALLTGAMASPILPMQKAEGGHLTLEDIQAHAVLDDDVHHAPTRLVCLENTLGGSILPLSTCQAISAWALAQSPSIPLHLDGARLWDAVAAGAGTLQEYCACFDSVSLCFSKGLGAPMGSIIVGEKSFIAKARHFRKAIGGGWRQSGVIAAAARVAVEETFLGGKLRLGHEKAKKVERMWVEKRGRLVRKVETGMCWLDLEGSGVDAESWERACRGEGVKVSGRGRVVCHYQTSDETLTRLARAMNVVLQP